MSWIASLVGVEYVVFWKQWAFCSWINALYQGTVFGVNCFDELFCALQQMQGFLNNAITVVVFYLLITIIIIINIVK